MITNGRSRRVSQGSCKTASTPIFFAHQNARQGGDDAGPVVHAEAQVVGALLEHDRNRHVLAQPLVGKGRNALGAAAADLARHAHQVAGHRDARGPRARAPSVIESVLAVFAPHPYRVVSALHAGQNGGCGNQRRPHVEHQPFGNLARAADQPDGVLQLRGVAEIHRGDAADAFHENVRRA